MKKKCIGIIWGGTEGEAQGKWVREEGKSERQTQREDMGGDVKSLK